MPVDMDQEKEVAFNTEVRRLRGVRGAANGFKNAIEGMTQQEAKLDNQDLTTGAKSEWRKRYAILYPYYLAITGDTSKEFTVGGLGL